MIRLSKLADYGIVMMTHMAREPGRQQTAPEIAARSHLPLPMASKILKGLARAGLLVSHRGAKGGYGLARPAHGDQRRRRHRRARGPDRAHRVHRARAGRVRDRGAVPGAGQLAAHQRAIREALEGITLLEMAQTVPAAFATPMRELAGRLPERRWRTDGRSRHRRNKATRPREGEPMATALDTVRDYTGHEYKYGFVTEIEADIVPKGLDEDVVRLISAKKGEPAWMTEWRLKALARWRTMEEPTLGQGRASADRLSGDQLLRRAQVRRRSAQEPGRGRSRAAAHLREARHPDPRAGGAGRRRGRLRVRQRLGRDHVQGEARRARRHLLLDLGGAARASGAGAALSRLGRAAGRQLLSPRSTPRCSPTAPSSTCPRACAARWSCRPTSGSTPPRPGSSSAP